VFILHKNLTNLSKKNIRSQINKNGGVYLGFSIYWIYRMLKYNLKLMKKAGIFRKHKILLRFYVKSE
jgi:repressor of nif and glnA expression